MEYYKINYDRLKNLKQINFGLLILFLVVCLGILLIIANNVYINKKISCYGVYTNNILKIEINNELSDYLKKEKKLLFDKTKMTYEIVSFDGYEIVDDEIFEKISLTVDRELYDNEVGKVTINYDKEKLLKYIFELFK